MSAPGITAAQLRAVRQLELKARGLLDSLFAGAYRSVFRGQGMEFAEVRAYEPGDDIRHIDWNVSARLAHPYVKTFTEERELTVFVMVDRSGSVGLGTTRTKADLATEIAACIGLAAAGQQDRVGALLFTDRVEQVIPPMKGRRHALRVVRDLLTFTPQGRRTDLGGALTYASRLLNHTSVVVILSDFVGTDWERPLRMLAARHEVVAIVIGDQRDGELPDVGWVSVEDAETGARHLVDSADARVRQDAARRHAARRAAAVTTLRRAGADAVELDTAGSWLDPLRRVFAARARRGGRR